MVRVSNPRNLLKRPLTIKQLSTLRKPPEGVTRRPIKLSRAVVPRSSSFHPRVLTNHVLASPNSINRMRATQVSGHSPTLPSYALEGIRHRTFKLVSTRQMFLDDSLARASVAVPGTETRSNHPAKKVRKRLFGKQILKEGLTTAASQARHHQDLLGTRYERDP